VYGAAEIGHQRKTSATDVDVVVGIQAPIRTHWFHREPLRRQPRIILLHGVQKLDVQRLREIFQNDFVICVVLQSLDVAVIQ
jgi:hypothetical protein